MAEDGYPSVNLMDSHATCPPVPPRLSQGQQCARVGQKALFILVSVALCGMIVEACLIHRLYQTECKSAHIQIIVGFFCFFTFYVLFSQLAYPPMVIAFTSACACSQTKNKQAQLRGKLFLFSLQVTSASISKIITEQEAATAAKLRSCVISPFKPLAHLTDGQDVVHAKDIMAWSTDADPPLYKIDYKDRSLVIQKEGYYYVYSKVSFSDTGIFHHRVDLRIEKFTGKSINLLKSRKYSNHFKHPEQSNSYLGGVFHFSKGDAIFVKVSNTSKIVRQDLSENVFGAYMI
ncbi:tumor necrosis factor ligand superfamily member 6-like [Thunnus thynnus]|uniref:tumor necrosis factor ligand superfamily member 6-like n=1 Tax=Thunnus thynnus TaxID=8237 RepID=UPI00352903CE